MLTCKEQVARSSDYLDGQLSFRETLMVRHHLMFCRNCRRFIRQMRLMQATLRAMPQKPEEGVDALAEQLAELRRDSSLVVGDNEPYSGHLPGDAIDRHALQQG